MTQTHHRVQVSVADRAVTLTRWLDAPREHVWAAWTDPAQLALWWGPNDFTTPVVRTDLRTGGALRIVMRSPAGGDYPIVGEYLEIVPPSRLVFTDLADELPADWHAQLDRERSPETRGRPLRIVVTVTFEERDGGTLLTIANAFESDDERDAVMRLGAADGWAEMLEKLDKLLTAG
jgi:uncharacterized protein YndB with AHSA1/START domain